MPETPKEKQKIEKDKNDECENASWGEDQKKREYYYDDAHGYQTFDPDNSEDEDPPEDK